MLPSSCRFCVSADDEFLLLMELELDPCSAAFSGLISRAAAFTNQTFKSEFPSQTEKLFYVFSEGDRIPNYT
jgi:hypothetical protein